MSLAEENWPLPPCLDQAPRAQMKRSLYEPLIMTTPHAGLRATVMLAHRVGGVHAPSARGSRGSQALWRVIQSGAASTLLRG